MGLERLACIVQDVDSMFDIDTLKDCVDQGNVRSQEYLMEIMKAQTYLCV